MTNSRAKPAPVFIPESLEIATGILTPTTGSYLTVDTEASASTDDCITITVKIASQLIVLTQANSSQDPTFKDGSDNLILASDFTLTNSNDKLTLVAAIQGSNFYYELSRSDNAT